MEFEITEGIPLPKSKGKPRKYDIPLDDMDSGALLPVQPLYKGESTHRRPVPDRSVWHDTRRMING